jgi:hypothetical protein
MAESAGISRENTRKSLFLEEIEILAQTRVSIWASVYVCECSKSSTFGLPGGVFMDPLIELDTSNLDGETVEQFVERNRKAVMVRIFQKAMAGDGKCLEMAGKIVSAPFIEKSKVLAISGGKVGAFEGIMQGGALGNVMEMLRRGEVKTDQLAPPKGDLRPNEVAVTSLLNEGRHEEAVADRKARLERRQEFTPVEIVNRNDVGGLE